MERNDLDLTNLPESVKKVLDGVDLETIKAITSNLDSSNVDSFVSSLIKKIKSSLNEEDAKTFEKVAKVFIEEMVKNKK